MMKSNLNKMPLWQMTGEELKYLLSDNYVLKDEIKNDESKERVKIQGIRGLMKFLNNCSSATAQKVKDSGSFPVYWVGNRFYCYSDEVELGLMCKKGGLKND